VDNNFNFQKFRDSDTDTTYVFMNTVTPYCVLFNKTVMLKSGQLSYGFLQCDSLTKTKIVRGEFSRSEYRTKS
jgi:hypothetical protein